MKLHEMARSCSTLCGDGKYLPDYSLKVEKYEATSENYILILKFVTRF